MTSGIKDKKDSILNK